MVKHNFNKVVNYCGSCGHYNPNAGTFSYCLVQEKDVWEGDHCDEHATEQQAKKWLEDEFKFMGTNCGSCGHYNPNAGTFSYCLVQEKDVWEGDHCDEHATEQQAKKWLEDEFKFMGTIFDRGDGRANFPKGDNQY